jgi:hypothetical protein
MERNRQSLKSLKASVSMEKYNAQLRDKEDYAGWVLYLPSSGAMLPSVSIGKAAA